MSVTSSKTGRFGNLTIAGNVCNITGWTCQIHREYAVATDSGNLDATGTPQLWRLRLPGEVWFAGTVDGFYDFGGAPIQTSCKSSRPTDRTRWS